MKKLIALVLTLVCVVGMVGCSAKDEVIGKTVFETENISRVTFYGTAPNSTETEVPSEYLAEITEWLGTFVQTNTVTLIQCYRVLLFVAKKKNAANSKESAAS